MHKTMFSTNHCELPFNAHEHNYEKIHWKSCEQNQFYVFILVVFLKNFTLQRDKLNEQTTKILCLIVNTGEYCKDRSEQFASVMGKALGSEWKSKIDGTPIVAEIKQQFDSIFESIIHSHQMCKRRTQQTFLSFDAKDFSFTCKNE